MSEVEFTNDETVFIVGFWFVVFLCSASVIFGVISWIVLPKWQQIRHYVFVNLLLSILLFTGMMVAALHLSVSGSEVPTYSLYSFIGNILYFAISQWFMVTTIVFYIDFIKVYEKLKEIRDPFLMINIFGWLLPVVFVTFNKVLGDVHKYFSLTIFCFNFLANFVMYFLVLYALYKGSKSVAKMLMSTLVFGLTSGHIILKAADLLLSILISSSDSVEADYLLAWKYSVYSVNFYFTILTALVINVFFVTMESHKELWLEYRSRNNDITALSNIYV